MGRARLSGLGLRQEAGALLMDQDRPGRCVEVPQVLPGVAHSADGFRSLNFRKLRNFHRGILKFRGANFRNLRNFRRRTLNFRGVRPCLEILTPACESCETCESFSVRPCCWQTWS
jgi:hypothetical protein